MLILNTTTHTRTALMAEPFGDTGAFRFVPIRGDQPGDPFILDADAVRELASFLTPYED